MLSKQKYNILGKKYPKTVILGGLFFVGLLVLIFLFSLNSQSTQYPPLTSRPLEVNTTAVARGSHVSETSNTVLYSLQGYNQTLIATQQSGEAAAWEFVKKAPSYGTTSLIPNGFSKEAHLTKNFKDSEDPFLLKNHVVSTSEHYFFDQYMQGIPVLSAGLGVHLRNGNQIYSVDGNLVKNQKLNEEKLTEAQAQNDALQKARAEGPARFKYIVTASKKYIVNKKALHISNDENNYITYAVNVRNEGEFEQFGKIYFIDASSGTIVYEENPGGGAGALTRNISGIAGTRTEGQAAINNVTVDTAYDLAGEYYNYFLNTFQRDGYDGKGSPMTIQIVAGTKYAYAHPDTYISEFSTDMISRSVMFHERSHLMEYALHGGAIETTESTFDEGNADTWAGLILGNWVFAINDTAPPDRNAQDPASHKQPEKVFSTNWTCGGNAHDNGVLISHTFYLISKGGTENGCTVAGIGEADAAKIHYQAETKYLKEGLTIGDLFAAENNACNDLFQQGSTQCTAVQAAMVATEIDQWPVGAADNPKCSSGTEKTPVCPAGGTTSSTAPQPDTSTQPNPPSTTSTSPQPNASQPSGAQPTFFSLAPCPTCTSPTDSVAPSVSQQPQPVISQAPKPVTVNPSVVVNPGNPGSSISTNIPNINPNTANPGLGSNGNLGGGGNIMQLIIVLLQMLMFLFSGGLF